MSSLFAPAFFIEWQDEETEERDKRNCQTPKKHKQFNLHSIKVNTAATHVTWTIEMKGPMEVIWYSEEM